MLVAFGFDGSLAESDAYTLLGEEAGVADEIADLAAMSRNGDLTLAESVRERAARLEGLPEVEIESALDRVSLRPGAADLLAGLQADDHHVAVITAAPRRAVDHALDAAGASADTVVAPTLEVERNALTGRVVGRFLEQTSGEALETVAAENEIPIAETLAVGSNDDDREMLASATDAVCVAPTPGLERHCETTVASVDALEELFAQRNLL